MQGVAKVGTSHRSHLHFGVERISDADRLCGFDEQLLELVRDLLYQDETLGSQADLPCIVKPPPNTSLDSFWNIRIVTHDKSIRPTQLHHCLLDDFPCFGGDCGTRSDASRYGRTLNPPVINDIDDIVLLEDQILEDTFRKTSFKHDALKLERASLRVPRVLHQDNIAGQYCWDSHARQLPDRKIPRHDRENRP